ncbi:kelch-like protein [Schistosoma mansoni]|nr:kelch-like protein [Schistosoma mansoni]|eukprot:XP_018648696.1 kelch-like protein [Schistosoma mansoni]
MRWVYHQPIERVANLPSLLRNIRLSVMSVRFLTDVVDKDRLIRQSLECRDLVDDAKRFHLRPDLRHEMRDRRFRQRDGGNEYLVVIGGFGSDQDPSDSVEMFNPRTLEWNELPDLPISYRYVAACSLGTCVYVIGGFDGNERLNTVYSLDIAQREEGWRLLTPMHYKRGLSAACTNKGLIYVCGGFDGQSRLRSFEVYHPKIDEWRILEEMTTAREGAGLVVVDDTLYCLGGYDGFHLLNSMEAFDLHCGTWSVCKPMYMRRSGAGCALLGDTIYVCGGYGGAEGRGPSHLDTVEAYNTWLAQWTLVTSMNVPRCYVGACPLAGKIYVAAGYNGNSLLDTVESYDPIENTWWLHEESRMNHERCDTGMCVVRFPTCSVSQDTLTPVITSRNVINSSNIHSSPSAVSSASVNFHSAISQSSTWHLNDFNTNRANNVRINTQISVGHSNPSSFQGSPSSTRNVLSSSVSEPFRAGSQFGCPSASMNICNVNSQSPGNSHLSSTNRRSNRQVRSHPSRQNSLSNTAPVNGRELRNSRPPRHLLSLTASSLYPGNINIWNHESMRLPYVAQGMHNPRNHRSLVPSLLCNPHNILRCNTTPISQLTQQVENPLFNHSDTLSHTLDNIPSSSEESYIIQNNESTVNSAFSMMQQTDQPLENCGNVDINELASNLNASHFDAPTVTGSHLPASQRSSCSSPTLVSDIHHSAPEYGSSASCKHELFRSVDAINRLDSDNVFWSVSNISTFSVIENPTAGTFSQAITFNEDLSNSNVVIGAQVDNISGNVSLENLPSRNYVSLVGDSPDEQDHSNTFGDVRREHGDSVKCTDRSSYKLRTFMNTLISKPRELQSNSCVLSSNDSSDLPCEQPCDITLASSHLCNSSTPIPIAKVKPCSSTVVGNSCTTTLNALPPSIRNTSSIQQGNDPSICRNKQTFDQLCQRYRPRVITIGETSFAFGVAESSHAYSDSDDLSIRNQSEDPNQTGVSVKPDVTCTTSVIESVHSTGAPGCCSSNSDDALLNQPHSLIDNPSNCEPDITLCTVVCNPGNMDDSPESQPDTRSDGEGEEGDDLDVVLRNPAVGQVDDE